MSHTKSCLCNESLCRKCLVLNCQYVDCKIHTITKKIIAKKGILKNLKNIDEIKQLEKEISRLKNYSEGQ